LYQNGTTNILNVGTDQNMYGGTNSDGGIFVYGNNKLHLSTNSVRRLTITGTGDIGIGITSPTVALQIDRATDSRIRLSNAGTVLGQLQASSTTFQVAAIGATTPLTFASNGSERMRITSDGSLVVGGTTADASAIVQITSTTKGFLPPVMTGAQAEAISATPAAGLLVYANNGNGAVITSIGWWGYNGTTWVKLN
jgi:hypothetical protein